MEKTRQQLEEELRFLKESLELGVITEEEFMLSKKRLDSKIKDMEKPAEPSAELPAEDEKETESAPVEAEKPAEEEKPTPAAVEMPEKQDEQPTEVTEIKEDPKTAPESEAHVMKYGDFVDNKEQTKTADSNYEVDPNKEELESGMKQMGILIVIALLVGGGIWFFSQDGAAPVPEPIGSPAADPSTAPTFEAACEDNSDCVQAGSFGICQNPGERTAECLFTQDAEFELTVIEADACVNCDTSRVTGIFEALYPGVNINRVDFDSPATDMLIRKFDIESLPAYIATGDFDKTQNFGKLSQGFTEIDGGFVMKPQAAGAQYFFTRDEQPDSVTLIVDPRSSASEIAQKNAQVFADAFANQVTYDVRPHSTGLATQLGVNTFPTFVVNNQLVVGGVQSADALKEVFCQINAAQGCSQDLSASII